MLQVKRPPVPLFNLEKKIAFTNKEQQLPSINNHLVQQYLQETTGNDCLLIIYLSYGIYTYIYIYIHVHHVMIKYNNNALTIFYC